MHVQRSSISLLTVFRIIKTLLCLYVRSDSNIVHCLNHAAAAPGAGPLLLGVPRPWRGVSCWGSLGPHMKQMSRAQFSQHNIYVGVCQSVCLQNQTLVQGCHEHISWHAAFVFSKDWYSATG